MRAKRVAVIMGGWSPERDVSLVSGRAACKALENLGHKVKTIDAKRNLCDQLLNIFPSEVPDIVFNALHGEWGEDGCVQGLLEVMGIPYTHSGVLASALAMDKERAKQALAAAGLPVPGGHLITSPEEFAAIDIEPPYVVKPNASGSSVNIFIIREGDNRKITDLIKDPAAFAEGILVEPYIPGRELTVAVMGDRPLAVTEIIAHTDFYDYEAKYADGGSSHIVPADLPPEITQACLDMALKAHQVLGCRGVSRTDFRFNESLGINGLFILELNTQPGLTPTSLAPEQAASVGISFEEMVDWMIGDASCRR
ncbi:D-alanine--D-alanine ligase [Parvularcula flava]|uniref:D-alanine--D-alanine ligase n=1 Tax=Aquisalinus luteolus TaxID=1566827 RepID=A0A8J3A3K8_9PROT|nr:D-alanine--D-alanine ligase [Aquisalinus luteolus]NHK29050.1 D-alanine--D-alanine ligase [Aquisalinus luteolus]GGI00465.1 D-alanine--D-alanine ligase [Aquisalinus luteolus]